MLCNQEIQCKLQAYWKSECTDTVSHKWFAMRLHCNAVEGCRPRPNFPQTPIMKACHAMQYNTMRGNATQRKTGVIMLHSHRISQLEMFSFHKSKLIVAVFGQWGLGITGMGDWNRPINWAAGIVRGLPEEDLTLVARPWSVARLH